MLWIGNKSCSSGIDLIKESFLGMCCLRGEILRGEKGIKNYVRKGKRNVHRKKAVCW